MNLRKVVRNAVGSSEAHQSKPIETCPDAAYELDG